MSGLMAKTSEPKQEQEAAPPPAEEVSETEIDPESLRVYRIRLVPGDQSFANGLEIISILDELKMVGTLEVVAHCEKVKPLSELEPTSCLIGWDIIVSTNKDQNDIEDVFIFLDPDAELKIELVDDERFDTGDDYLKLGDILVERGDLSTTKMNEVLDDQNKLERKRFGEVLEDSGAVSPERIESALAEQQAVRKNRSTAKAKSRKSIRVDGLRLDKLVDMAGELVIIQARLHQLSAKVGNPEVEIISEELERLSADLRDATLGIRMSPIGSTFGKYRRMLRDLAAELGKNVELTTEGAETELDKTVIELLSEPLLHIIRNGLDHGIEPPEVRRAAGKPVGGMMKLVASHVGGEVLIKVQDDGAGLDAAKIYKKALEQGLVDEEAELSEEEIFQLLLEPGFSTAASVTELSGRGVGLDIVNRKIEELGGSVHINGALGKGTTTTIRLPLTLAIIEGLMVKSGEELYVLPLRIVEECVELTREQDEETHGHKLVNVRGDMVPYMRLREWFSIEGAADDTELAVIIEIEDVRFGFVVDSIIGQLQVVIKKLSSVYKDVKGLAGATILGDGSVALILDARQLIQGAAVAQKMKFTG
jgi:two-component system chemotaxis sensor kinase CheA